MNAGKLFVFALFTVGLCPAPWATDLEVIQGSSMSFATVEEARSILKTRDEFVKSMSPFDRAARMKTDRVVPEDEFLDFAAACALPWTAGDEEKVEQALETVRPKLSALRLSLPPKITLIKTTGGEEGGAAYTRYHAIILPQDMIGSSWLDFRRILSHELFHILTRQDPRLRDALYAAIGFLKCNEIEYPGVLASRKITNPDAFLNDHYIRVSVNGELVAVVPILFSEQANYDVRRDGEFFQYLTLRFLAVEESGGKWTPVYRDGQPLCFQVGELTGFYEQIGRNVRQVLQPDEILADNFAALITGQDDAALPETARKIEQVLRTYERSTP